MPPKKRKVVRGRGIFSGLKKAAKVVHHVAKAVGSKQGQDLIARAAKHKGLDVKESQDKVNRYANIASTGARIISGEGKKRRKIVRGTSLVKPNMYRAGFSPA